jgi:hypothetical protein
VLLSLSLSLSLFFFAGKCVFLMLAPVEKKPNQCSSTRYTVSGWSTFSLAIAKSGSACVLSGKIDEHVSPCSVGQSVVAGAS